MSNDTADAARDYALGADEEETARLRRQSAELRPEAEALLDQAGLRPGQSAIDLGCGPSGLLDLLAAALGPSGRVVGLDADPVHVAAAARFAAEARLGCVSVLAGDARRTGLPDGEFDLVHARTLLITVPAPGEVVAEMARLARPGGWVACQEPDVEHALCYPPLPEWERIRELLALSFVRSGADPRIGRRVPELLRQGGLEPVEVTVHANCYPAGHSRRTLLPDLVRSLRPVLTDRGLASEAELAELDEAVRAHLADPRVLMMPHLLVGVLARKPLAPLRVTGGSRGLPSRSP